MDSPHHPESVPVVKARVAGTGQPPPQTAQYAAGPPVQPPPENAPAGRKRPNRLQVGALALFALGLVALSTWWVLSRLEAGESAPDMIPKNPVRLINSQTPIPERRSPLAVKDSTGDMAYAPESEGWSQQLREAHRAQEEGRYDAAIAQYPALVNGADREVSHDALWGLASAYADSGQMELAVRSYALFTYLREDPRATRAFFRIGQLNQLDQLSLRAAEAYAEYVKHAGPARDAVNVLRAGLLWDDKEAEQVYKSVIDGKPQDADLREALAGLAEVKSRQGEHKESAALYDRLAVERKSRPRPVLDDRGEAPEALAAAQLRLAGDTEAARKRLIEYVKGYVKGGSGYADGLYGALVDLLEIDKQAVVSDTIPAMPAARIAFNAGDYGEAIGYMDVLRATQPASPERPAAALLTGRAFAAVGDYTSAYNWYTATAQTYPTAPEAPEAMRRAADALRVQAAWDAALGTYKQAVEKYPGSPQADLARIDGAVLAYRLEQRDEALGLLGPLAQRPELSPTLKAEAMFWRAKVEKSQANPTWKESMQQVSRLAPGSLLDFRSRSLLAGEPDGGPTVLTFAEAGVAASSLGVQYDKEAAERRELLAWAEGLQHRVISGTQTLPATKRPAASPGAALSAEHPEKRIAQDPEVERAVALLSLGAWEEAYTSFRALAERLREEGDALGLAEVGLYLRYHADPQTAMSVAETLASMDHREPPLQWPKLLLKTLYPTPYGSLVMTEAETRQVDPLLVYALMRQESRFVPDAHSHADARGLAQVIPSTGQGIAEQLGDSNFTASDLYLPYVSVRYGTFYLASNLPQFDHKLFPTLAAYNGGPGNAARWLSGSALFDPDLYAERIDLFETQDYLEQVYLNYGFYRSVYGK